MTASIEYTNLKNAEAAFEANDSIENVLILEAAEKAYFAKVIELKAKWELITGTRRDSAEQNAYDTQIEGNFEAADEVAFYICALGTADLIEE